MKTRLRLSCGFVLCMNTAAYVDIVTDGTSGKIPTAQLLPPHTHQLKKTHNSPPPTVAKY